MSVPPNVLVAVPLKVSVPSPTLRQAAVPLMAPVRVSVALLGAPMSAGEARVTVPAKRVAPGAASSAPVPDTPLPAKLKASAAS